MHSKVGTLLRSVFIHIISPNSRHSNDTKKVLLVGGLGLSIYLQKFIEVRLASKYPGIELIPIGIFQ